MEKNIIKRVFTDLLESYGLQGWWPVYSLRCTEGRDSRGYYNQVLTYYSYSEELSPLSRFEIAIGSVLTQNTAWTNVERALENLESAGLLDPDAVIDVPISILSEALRPSGYYNQKAKKLKILAAFLLEGNYLKMGNAPERKDLLNLWGVGKETADSILLYAYDVPVFVVDAYTKRIFTRLKILTGSEEYDEIAEIFINGLGKDSALFKEYHALIVKHAKEYCRKNPVCGSCVLKELCSFYDIIE